MQEKFIEILLWVGGMFATAMLLTIIIGNVIQCKCESEPMTMVVTESVEELEFHAFENETEWRFSGYVQGFDEDYIILLGEEEWYVHYTELDLFMSPSHEIQIGDYIEMNFNNYDELVSINY